MNAIRDVGQRRDEFPELNRQTFRVYERGRLGSKDALQRGSRSVMVSADRRQPKFLLYILFQFVYNQLCR